MRKTRFTILGLMGVVALALILVVPQAQAAEYWKAKYERFSGTAGETLAVGDVVCIKEADGKIYQADADSSTLRPAVGAIGKGGASGATVEVVSKGVLAGQTAASAGYRLWLSATAGALTTTTPTNEQALGFVLPAATAASTNTVYMINVQMPQNDGAGY